MQWLDATLIEPVWHLVSAIAPNNASSLTLALIGVGTLLILGIGRRARSRDRSFDSEASPPAVRSEERRAA